MLYIFYLIICLYEGKRIELSFLSSQSLPKGLAGDLPETSCSMHLQAKWLQPRSALCIVTRDSEPGDGPTDKIKEMWGDLISVRDNAKKEPS